MSNVKCRIANEGELGMLKTAMAEVFKKYRLRLCHEQEKWHRKTFPLPCHCRAIAALDKKNLSATADYGIDDWKQLD